MEAKRIIHCPSETEDMQLDLWSLLGTTRVVTDALMDAGALAGADASEEKDRSARPKPQSAGREVAAGSGKPQGAAKAGVTVRPLADSAETRPLERTRRR